MTESEWILIHGVHCLCTKDTISVKRSFELAYLDLEFFCRDLRKTTAFEYKRSNESWIQEIVAHNILHSWGLFESHVIDTDIEENESKFKLFIYKLIYRLNNVFYWYR